MSLKLKFFSVVTVITLFLAIFSLLSSNNSLPKPINFSEGFDFKEKPNFLSFSNPGVNPSQKSEIIKGAIIGLKYSNNRGYPIYNYEITDKTIKLFIPTLERGYYYVIFKGSKTNFSIGMNGEKIPTSNTECYGKSNVNECMILFYKYKTLQEGSKAALDDLYALTSSKSDTLFLCHNWSHAIGQMTGFVYKTYNEAINVGYDVCHFGYYHGVMESFSSLFSDQELKKYFSLICNSFSYGFTMGDCVHGLGHIAWWRTGGDFQESVKWCSLESTSIANMKINERGECVTGVAMEWSNKYTLSSKKIQSEMAKGLKEPVFICKTLKEDDLAAGCWEFIGPIWGGNDKNILHMSKVCETLKGLQHESCWLGIGREEAFRPEVSAQKAIALCLTATGDTAKWWCLDNVVHSKTVSSRKAGIAKLVCDIVPKNMQDYQYWCSLLLMNEREKIKTEGRNDITSKVVGK